MSMGAFKAAMEMYISYKFCGLKSRAFAVNAAQLCTAGINQHSVNSSTSTRGQHVCDLLLLTRGRHCYTGRARLCNTFLVIFNARPMSNEFSGTTKRIFTSFSGIG